MTTPVAQPRQGVIPTTFFSESTLLRFGVTFAALRRYLKSYGSKGSFGVSGTSIVLVASGCRARRLVSACFGPNQSARKEANNPLAAKVSVNLQNYYVGSLSEAPDTTADTSRRPSGASFRASPCRCKRSIRQPHRARGWATSMHSSLTSSPNPNRRSKWERDRSTWHPRRVTTRSAQASTSSAERSSCWRTTARY